MVKGRYTYFFDVQTQKDKITRVNVNYGGQFIQNILLDYFIRYKYFKPSSIKINIKPCATLPVDPAGLSYTAGEQTVDPRDIFSLGMVRITNGERIPSVPSELSADNVHKLYDTMMLDRRWFKFSPHRGLVKSAIPKYWSVAQLQQDKFPGLVQRMPGIKYNTDGTVNSVDDELLYRHNYAKYVSDAIPGWSTQYSNAQKNVQIINRYQQLSENLEKNRPLVQNGLEPVRFMPTDEFVQIKNVPEEASSSTALKTFDVYNLASTPSGQIMVIYFPPSYKTFNYFRVWVTETYDFKGYVNNMNVNVAGTYSAVAGMASIDRFIRPYNAIQQVAPWQDVSRIVEHNLKD